jgi:hypothetical protein
MAQEAETSRGCFGRVWKVLPCSGGDTLGLIPRTNTGVRVSDGRRRRRRRRRGWLSVLWLVVCGEVPT